MVGETNKPKQDQPHRTQSEEVGGSRRAQEPLVRLNPPSQGILWRANESRGRKSRAATEHV